VSPQRLPLHRSRARLQGNAQLGQDEIRKVAHQGSNYLERRLPDAIRRAIVAVTGVLSSMVSP